MFRTLDVIRANRSRFRLHFQLQNNLSFWKSYINGEWIEANDGERYEIKNPADGEIIRCVPNMKIEDCQKAIEAAKCAFHSEEWSSLCAKQRSQLLKIAEVITAESGKPITEAKREVLYGSSFIEWFGEEARRIRGEIVPYPKKDREILVVKQPLGVAGLITPWNFPLSMITRKAGAALAAGCTLVVKPSSFTPLTCLAVTRLAEEAGFPKGVINVVTTKSARTVGEYMCNSPDIQIISFTGSTRIGKIVYGLCSKTMKRISLELGGNAPLIVFDSADLKNAVESALAAKFRNCGQACTAANRIFVQEGIYKQFVDKFKTYVEDLSVGHGRCENTQIGPLINEDQLNKMNEFVKDAREKNACILTGGEGLPQMGKLFFAPTIITEVPREAKIYAEEIFGPIAPIIKFKGEKEVLQKANETRVGLAGYFFSENLQQVFRVAKCLEVGMIGINEGIISTTEAPFGGVKESGIGREAGHQGVDEYVDIKYICLGNLKY
uniref:Succinate-semialdehyde dehydrogenase, mitochondrial n=1 Tax=Glossina austeni TaxID=7395 RepID=A0A1A9VYC2_GLOAU